ncbi:ergot alkaloid biosynthesis protein [Gynuella sunshinyii]|uniref:Putative nucleoside-diphosphate-sugar epimerase n=1 Tax=Gynuella sunshinyii YC6258 TaxID=1445510 RepID=A0A0C5VLK6_9GAMM|nr:ergot alkaloid biosynthesis protein [Gynuella sunshinyii]AJQ94208.1 putative nucleoside-diphosphate-sugar epimerase [Gynuella sunshinyii YC6258]
MINNILVTGGTGKTGRNVVEQLQQQGFIPRIATRNPMAPDTVRFDWKDPSAFQDAFEGIDAVYLVAPTDDFDSLGAMQNGLSAALDAGIKRFVLLSASSLEEGGPMMGAVHAWLRENAQQWAVLRPSWFMENLSEGQHRNSIKMESTIYSATQHGRIGFISAQDIARCAATLLTSPQVENNDHILTGPEAISYDHIAEILSRHLGKTIQHKCVSTAELAKRFRNLGYPEDYADGIAAMDEAISIGSENHISTNVKAITGISPVSMNTFVQNNIEAWKN